jgi:BirA family transcriptional regulator, biotin operon repressor / biotin---[acetyl-CoA-carboxylase] ligase
MKTLFIGQHLTELSSVDSTNDYCLQLLSHSTVLEGTVVWAHAQTKGRGQRGKSWVLAAKEGLAISVVLYPKVAVTQQFYFNKAMALGVCEALVAFGIDAQIKWPNDIYVGREKVAGILIENALRGPLLQSAVVGVGINVNQTQFPNDIPNPISMRQLLNNSFDRKEVLEELCYTVEKRYMQFKAGHFKKIEDDYHAVLYRMGQQQLFRKENVCFEAQIVGVTQDGKIKLLHQGDTAVYAMSEVEFII